MYKVHYSLLILVSQEVIVYIYVFGSGVETWVLAYGYGTGAVTEQRHSLRKL